MEGDHSTKPLLHGKYSESAPRISTDGRSIDYASDESGQYEVYVRPFPGVDTGKWKISTNGGIAPLWAAADLCDTNPDGKRFLMIKQGGGAASKEAGPPQINIVLNWFEELKQRVPVR